MKTFFQHYCPFILNNWYRSLLTRLENPAELKHHIRSQIWYDGLKERMSDSCTCGDIASPPRGSPSRMSVPALYMMMSGRISFSAPSEWSSTFCRYSMSSVPHSSSTFRWIAPEVKKEDQIMLSSPKLQTKTKEGKMSANWIDNSDSEQLHSNTGQRNLLK